MPPTPAPASPAVPSDPITTPSAPQPVVEAFLDALVSADPERASELLAPDVEYSNVGLPTIRGRDAVVRTIARLDRPRVSFEVYVHAISAGATTVLTERTDVLAYGRYRMQFWVTGRFDVIDGRITLWRDAFDYVDVLRGSLRGLVALVVPRWTPAVPLHPATAPGRHAPR